MVRCAFTSEFPALRPSLEPLPSRTTGRENSRVHQRETAFKPVKDQLDFRADLAGKTSVSMEAFPPLRPGSPTSRPMPASVSRRSPVSSTSGETSPRRPASACSRRSDPRVPAELGRPGLSLKRTLVIGVVLPFLTEASPIERVRGVVDGARLVPVRHRAVRRRVGRPAAARVPPARRGAPHRRPARRLADPAGRRGRRLCAGAIRACSSTRTTRHCRAS